MERLSIIIPVFNNYEWTELCLKNIQECTKDYRVILVDNGSTDETKSLESEMGGTIVIRNKENLGFPKAINQGLKEVNTEFVCILNNDILVTPGWSDYLTGYLENGFSIVGPVTNYSSGMQRVRAPIYRDSKELYEMAGSWHREYPSKIRIQEVNWVIGYCMLFRKDLVDKIGFFDDSLFPCSGEEVDFCLRARREGFRIGIAKDIYVHHEGSMTFKIMDDIDYVPLCERNAKHLRKKWGLLSDYQEVTPEVHMLSDIAKENNNILRLNLGSGLRKQDGYINIDNREEVKPDLLLDVMEGLPYATSSVDEVRAFDFLEHIPAGQPAVNLIEEIYRVLKPSGKFEHQTPSTDGRGAFQDPYHLSYWNINSWVYFMDDFSRNLYGIKAKFSGENVNVVKNSELNIIHVCGILYPIKDKNPEQKIEVITCWYNEEFLAPFFLRHYDWVDKITVLLGENSTDKTKEILQKHPKVSIIPLTMTEGLNDLIKTEAINREAVKSTADWLLIVDADEFVFINRGGIENIPVEADVVNVNLACVYRHASEKDLDLLTPIQEQRSHGIFDKSYVKPILARTGRNIRWGPGNHNVTGRENMMVYLQEFLGAHWANADPIFSVKRRVQDRSSRLSKINMEMGMGTQNHNITENAVVKECQSHENDPALWDVLGGTK